jgi:hypothetical protein
MQPFTVTVQASAGGSTVSPAYVVCSRTNPCNIGIGVVTSGATYSVQHTFADPFAINLNASVSAVNWLNNDTLVSASVNDDTNYAFPPTAVRLRVNAGSGEATMTINQSGPNY